MHAVATEEQEKIRRAKNLVISGLTEAKNSDQQEKQDTKLVEELLHTISVDKKVLTKCRRLKKKTSESLNGSSSNDIDKPALLVITLDSESSMFKILKKAKLLKVSNKFNKTYLNRDKTEMEREADKN
jgi:hypothetical protein